MSNNTVMIDGFTPTLYNDGGYRAARALVPFRSDAADVIQINQGRCRNPTTEQEFLQVTVAVCRLTSMGENDQIIACLKVDEVSGYRAAVEEITNKVYRPLLAAIIRGAKVITITDDLEVVEG